mmetsp:Transcript_8610/g.21863  ORF Transcript_8610/g.21863 Transcript_8610/m.21863 type:complete len:215 (+) Transcript_8610:56-700(+)|eukprot:CAMPEP_0202038058 /NCGR_PEP_ID=MMETSP0962-20130828/5777_1 /ASSEMBLY_ACC=CAM_ASM_000488 /TAXON_ID=4773 /ORGANISM="Schizochytrium aggregatum, Strain ATCC28209" /LENGTH=214 /DNA_ID=CAMNT_0048602203 /DNA_START=56 /DNA_END=700 /DNA_ORIENTATION=-
MAAEDGGACRLFFKRGAASMGPHIVANWAGLPLELCDANGDVEAVKAANRLMAVPTLVLPDGKIITQNMAILQYVARRTGCEDLLGDDDALAQAELLQWSAFLSTELQEATRLYFYTQKYTTGSEEDDLSKVKEAGRALLANCLEILNERLAGREWIVGEARTIVDAQAFPMIRWSVKVVEGGYRKYPNLKAFMDRLCKDEGVIAAAEREGLDL